MRLPEAQETMAMARNLPFREPDLVPAPPAAPDSGPGREPDRGLESVGTILRRARFERGGKPIGDIAQDLRIRAHLLEALEADDYDKLPGLIYAAGFLRAYAHYLGLDGSVLVERLKDSGRTQALEAQLVFPEPLQDPRIPRPRVVILAATLALAIYGAWYGFFLHGPQTFDDVPAPTAEFAALISASKREAAAAVAEAEAEAFRQEYAALAASSEIEPEAPDFEGAPAETDASPGEAVAAAAPEAVVPAQVSIKARAEAWVRIEGPDSKRLVDRVLQPGEVVNAPAGQGFVMMTGNAGALDLALDGKAVASLGPEGGVRRHVALDSSLLELDGGRGQ